jgi:kinetochore protein Mis12/MTW1
MNSLEELRQKVEQVSLKPRVEFEKLIVQMRYLSQQLESAEKALDRRLEIARQRKAEVGFIQEVLAGANREFYRAFRA